MKFLSFFIDEILLKRSRVRNWNDIYINIALKSILKANEEFTVRFCGPTGRIRRLLRRLPSRNRRDHHPEKEISHLKVERER